ncbi:hypothetical protein Tco_0359375 [Tanacetum coccineum]
MAQVRKLSPEQLQEEFDKIQRAVAFTRGFKRDGSPMTRASSKKLKTSSDDVNLEFPSHGVPQEEAGATPFQNVSQVELLILSLSGLFTDVNGDPEAEHKMCIKYASDADSASDDDTPVNFYDVIDWELLTTRLGSINVFYRKDNSRKCFTSLREIIHLVTRADLMTIYGHVMTFYQDKKAAGIGLVLWGDLKVLMDSPEVNDGSDVWKNQQTWKIQSWKLYSYSGVHVLEIVSGLVVHMFIDKKYPLSVTLSKRMLDHQLEFVTIFGIQKLRGNSRDRLDSYSFGNLVEFAAIVTTSRYVVPTGRVKVPAGRYVVPTGKDKFIVSAGRTKVIPAGSTILVLRKDLSRAGPTSGIRAWREPLLKKLYYSYS